MKSLSVTIQMKATEQYFPMVLCIVLCKVVLSFESAGVTIKPRRHVLIYCKEAHTSWPLITSYKLF